MIIRIEHGKGGKERHVMLSAQSPSILRTYWRLARPGHRRFPGAAPTARSSRRRCTRPAGRRGRRRGSPGR
jgi:integrase